jgi:hypothetical protein
VLLRAEGFAGRITVEDGVCTWHRALNWQGFPCPVDAGRMSFDAAGRLIEDGVHAEYREEWEAVAEPAFAARPLAGDGLTGLLVHNARTFLLALGQEGAPARPGQAEALRNGTAAPQDAAPAFASVHVLGRWEGTDGIATLSTQPFCEGRRVLTLDGPELRVALPGFDGAPRRLSLRTPLTEPLTP